MDGVEDSRALHMCLKGKVHLPSEEGCPEPTAEINITENGIYDVSDYSKANVEVVCEELPSARGEYF